MKSFLIKLSLFLIPFILIAFVNYQVDNAHIFSGESEYKSIANIISHEHNVANLYNFNEILLYKNLIKELNYNPDILIIGSSRSMEINNNMFPDKHIFNASISECSLKEIIAIYSLFEQNNIKPKSIIYNIDPFVFLNADRSNGFRCELIEEYNAIAGKIGIDSTDKSELLAISASEWKSKIKELFNPGYFYENIRYGSKEFYQTDEVFTNVNVLCKDGSIAYNEHYRQVTENEALNSAKLYLHGLDLDKKKIKIDKKKVAIFEKFVNYLQKQHQVTFFLSPLHPYVLKDFTAHQFNLAQIEKYITETANTKNIKIVGSFNPQNLGLTTKDFYDGNHTKRKGIEKIFKNNNHIN